LTKKKEEDDKSSEEDEEKEKPSFKPSGVLNKEFKIKRGVEINYIEAGDAEKPVIRWRLYPFKEDKDLEPYKIHRQSMYLFGRDRKAVDIPLDHPSCSKHHAVLQYRTVTTTDEEGRNKRVNKPYIIDLDSTNGTFLNGAKVDPRRYIELFPKDILKFGNSTRDFVLIHEGMN